MTTPKARYLALPRAARWLLWAGLAVATYFALVEPALTLRDRFQAKADKAAMLLASHEDGGPARADAEAAIAGGIARFGLIAMPTDDARRATEFNRAIDGILERHSVTEHTSTTDASGPPDAALASLFGPDTRVDRLVRHLQFEAPPDRVAGLIADLERSPVVSGVARVEISPGSNRDTPGLVRARISVETLVLEKKGRAR